MALTFDGTTGYLAQSDVAGINVTGPRTWAATVWVTNDVVQVMYSLYRNDLTNFFHIGFGDNWTGSLTDELVIISHFQPGPDGNLIVGYQTPDRTQLFDGKRHSLVVTWTASSSYRLYLDGVEKLLSVGQGTGNDNTSVPNALRSWWGARDYGSGVNALVDGTMQDMAIWSRDIGPAGAVAYARGASPFLISPQSLLSYIPGRTDYSPTADLVGTHQGTLVGGVTQAEHFPTFIDGPQIITQPLIITPPAPGSRPQIIMMS